MRRALVLLVAFVALIGCSKKGMITVGTVDVPSLPSMELDVPVAVFVDIDALMSSRLARNLPSLRTVDYGAVNSFLKERLGPCFTTTHPSSLWILVPSKEQGAVVLASMPGSGVLSCLGRMPGATRLEGSGVEIGGTVYLAPSPSVLLAMPSTLLTRIRPGQGTIGAAKLVRQAPDGVHAAIFFRNLSLVDERLARLIAAAPQGQEELTAWFKEHPAINGAVTMRASSDLEIAVVLDLGDETGARAMASRMEGWLREHGRTGRVILDHGVVEMRFALTASEVDSAISRFIAMLRTGRRGRR